MTRTAALSLCTNHIRLRIVFVAADDDDVTCVYVTESFGYIGTNATPDRGKEYPLHRFFQL